MEQYKKMCEVLTQKDGVKRYKPYVKISGKNYGVLYTYSSVCNDFVSYLTISKEDWHSFASLGEAEMSLQKCLVNYLGRIEGEENRKIIKTETISL